MKFEINQFGHPEIPSSLLRVEDIPFANVDYRPEIMEFALTFDGYSHFSDALPQFANRALQDFVASGKLSQSLDHLRACLFYQQRVWRNEGCDPDAEAMQFISALLGEIRAMVHSHVAGENSN